MTVFVFWYTQQNGEKENYTVFIKNGEGNHTVLVSIENGVCNVTVNGTLPSKLDIYIDSQKAYGETVNYNLWFRKNVTLYVTQELDSTPEIDFEENQSSIPYCIRLENCSFSWAMTMITFSRLYYSEGRLLRDPDWIIQIIIKEPFTSFFMHFETFKEDG